MSNLSDKEQGIAAFEAGNYVEALSIFLPLAQAGDRDAQCSIGCIYDPILGSQPDLEKAIEWYTKSALLGHPVAQNNLATLYLHQQKVDKAIKWYEIAAAQNFAFAKAVLADIYSGNLGIKLSN